MLTVQNVQYVQCVNCWQLHLTNKEILQHWTNRKCIFYCTICGKPYHNNSINDLKTHFNMEHGISYEKYQQLAIPTMQSQVAAKKTTDIASEKVKTATKPKLELAKKSTTQQSIGKSAAKMKLNPNEFGEFQCEECLKSFKSHKAYRAHHTLVHGKKHWLINKTSSGNGMTKPRMIGETVVNPIAVLKRQAKSNKNQKTLGKKFKKRTNEAVMKTIIRKVPNRPAPISLNNPPPLLPARKSKSIDPQIGETLIQTSTTSLEAAINNHNQEMSQDQTVSSTFLATSSISNENIVQIKPEPELDQSIDDFSNNYTDTPVQSCNGSWILPPDYENVGMGWNQNIDPYSDMSPRLKVKDLTDLQNPRQERYPVESQGYHQPQQQHQPLPQPPQLHQMQQVQSFQPVQQTSSIYKDPQPLIMPNANMTGLQIQNVQSYQQPPPPPQQQQTYVDYQCVNGMNTSMNIPSHPMCTSNLYEMHISQAQQMQSTQLINPVFLLPTNSTHPVQDYHY